jgi:hypothetical protein
MSHLNYFTHETKKQIVFKFLLVLGILISYFAFLTFRYGAKDGLAITVLTWSFFVLCTPIADAGFLIDFPLRLITKIRMFHSEMIVWTIAISINIYTFFFSGEAYQKTFLLKIFHFILEKPFPFWFIIFLSGIGTFLSVYFGDELIDVVRHQDRKKHQQHKVKHRFIIFVFLITLTLILYKFLLTKLGINIPI